ncbi:STAS domain-containing protein [Actinoplanes oblitus]|uniref:STAS domain-containing protein n=1 Tax=Actinoplanes oblitus TaxID=3040509 RepID=A0ABY8W834_9ACTN|nr:STAS domain-containing protein [Actinoplanes oblitus]WIM93095.1 STAS domain-containing protein [Actinoplanes oblitus]
MSSGYRASLDVSGQCRLQVCRVATGPGAPLRLVLSGELDRREAGGLVDRVTTLLREHPGRALEFDAGPLTFVDSGGIRALEACFELAEAAGSRLSITAVCPIVHQVLCITDVVKLFGDPGQVMDGP